MKFNGKTLTVFATFKQEEAGDTPQPDKIYPQAVIDIAMAEVGYLEKASNAELDSKTANAGSANYTKYARDLDAIDGFYNGRKQANPWCEVFVDWCFIQAYGVEMAKQLLCQPSNSLGASTRYSAQYYKNKGQFHTSPKVGDQIFFGTVGAETHTGIVYNVTSTNVFTIEGNTAPQDGVVDNGGGVYRKSYAINSSSIAGYGRPQYDEEEAPEQSGKTPLDFVAWNGKTYRDIFVTGNKLTTGNAITDTTTKDWVQYSGAYMPGATTEHYNTAPSSWDCSNYSRQMYKEFSLPVGHDFYIACKRKLISYTSGKWLGIEVYFNNGSAKVISDAVDASFISEDFKTVSHTFTPTTATTRIWVGCGGSARLEGYVDDIVCFDMTEMFGDNRPSRAELDKLYESFLLLYNIEFAN